jgi:hypothetical protein
MKYRCPECGWVGTEDEMWGDYISDDFWSKTICPGCEIWWCLDDYEIVKIDTEDEAAVTEPVE